MATWHNIAEYGDIAETVLLPGDPLRAKYIAENYLEDYECFNHLRCMFGYTGLYKGVRLSVMATGIGIPSMGIYSYELINTYKCKNLIRIGTSAAMQSNIELGDIIIALGASTDSNYAHSFKLPGSLSATCSYDILKVATDTADKSGISYKVGNVVSQDVLYCPEEETKAWAAMGLSACDMESYGLYLNAMKYDAKALALLTCTYNIETQEELEHNDGQVYIKKMIELALETAIKL